MEKVQQVSVIGKSKEIYSKVEIIYVQINWGWSMSITYWNCSISKAWLFYNGKS